MQENATFRTPETEAVYLEHIRNGGNKGDCPLCGAESIMEFGLWRIIDNKYPYDAVASVHHMVLPKRHASEDELTDEEWAEYETLKRGHINDTYGYIVEPTRRKKSIPGHAHLHLIIAKGK